MTEGGDTGTSSPGSEAHSSREPPGATGSRQEPQGRAAQHSAGSATRVLFVGVTSAGILPRRPVASTAATDMWRVTDAPNAGGRRTVLCPAALKSAASVSHSE